MLAKPIRAIDLNGDKKYILTYVGCYEPKIGRRITGAGTGNDMFQAAGTYTTKRY